jgi:serine O-acetyltransferase
MVGIALNVFDEGLCIIHPEMIRVTDRAKIGKNCKLFHNITIGNRPQGALSIGNNVYIGCSAIIIGK